VKPQTLSVSIMNVLEGKGLSMREMASVVGVHPSELSRIRSGSREWTTSQLIKIAEFLKMPLGALLLYAMREIEDRAALNDQFSRLLDELITEVRDALESLSPAA